MARSVTVRGTTSGDADPSPVWVLRHHSPCPITALAFVDPNVSVYGEEEGSDSDDEQDGLSRTSAFILEGDADGRVSLTDLNTLRPVLEWQAHRQGHSILGVEMWHNTIVTHGRDNTFKVWKMPLLNPRKASFATQDEIAANEHSTTPSEVLIHEVNALNFCRFSLLPIGTDGKQEALLAVPHTLESGWIDIYHLPSRRRLHTAIGRPDQPKTSTGMQRAAILMSLHLFYLPGTEHLALCGGYEDGTIQLWLLDAHTGSFALKWKTKAHSESVLSTAISIDDAKQSLRLISTGADTRLALVTMQLNGQGDGEAVDLNTPSTDRILIRTTILQTEKAGRACASFVPQSLKLVVGGWDGKARIYHYSTSPTTSDLTCTSVLRYHNESVQAVSATSSLIALGSKDGRISLWNIPLAARP